MPSSAPLKSAEAPAGPSAWGGRAFARPETRRVVFATAYILAAVVTAAGIWLVATAPGAEEGSGEISASSRVVLGVLLVNLILIGALAAVMGARVLSLVRSQAADPAARLHLRFVTLFSLVALTPTVLVAVVFGVLVNRGVEGWFSQNVRSAVENGAEIAQTYVNQEYQYVYGEAVPLTQDLATVRQFWDDRITFSRALEDLATARGFAALYVVDSRGRVLARGEQTDAPPYLAAPPESAQAALNGELPIRVTEGPDAVRGLIALPDYGPDLLLQIVRPMREGMMQRLRTAEASVVSYRAAEEARERLQVAFGLSYAETALLVLVGAVWLGMGAANAITGPVGRLVVAAGRVASGDLKVRVDASQDPAEIAVLSNAFNRMTSDLEVQQEALRRASDEAQTRSQFIETVLSGVSAGVIGLDESDRVSALNGQAKALLGLHDKALGQSLRRLAPEMVEVLASPSGAETEIDLGRGAETRRLRVRISGEAGGERVLTFDDITRLVSAQRNAAWRDVARRIAHEIKNPLTPIQLSAERLRRKYRERLAEDVETFDRCTETIIRQVGDIGRMVDEFSSFARMPTPKFAREDGAELLRQAVFAQRVAAPDYPVDLADLPDDGAFVADGRMVAQALTNVLKNAGEALAGKPGGEGGRLRAELIADDRQLTFVIEDDGPGLPAKDRERLTEPYVTTRERGTGLGLAIVKRICEDHGGELTLGDAQTLSGARVALIFPRTAVPAEGAGGKA
ncbi:PAS domain-containing sensor histidine kinase [Brevundimonas sp. 2R-24]|uniref:histidine kinase n=1 Tax=Peiella sedimenti TaxID=3061083 RepID=A0ABT8SJN6_9CAUL|nr:PAS domain-containing sensor histidine kinase [Caulobacteraceae bacterium XZ-24]